MTALYNEIDPFAVEWLWNLINGGHIAKGRVDYRSIVDLRPDDLRGFTQFHAFAGIGGWSHALRLAGWPDDVPCWTVSCPCQSFSNAGKKKGFDDERHLWPEAFKLIKECRPSFLASKLAAQLDSGGSTLFVLTLKERATPSGLSIPALRASVRRTSGNGCISWPTPTVNDSLN